MTDNKVTLRSYEMAWDESAIVTEETRVKI